MKEISLIAKRKVLETITWIPKGSHFFNPVSCPIHLRLTHYERLDMSKPPGQQLYELVNGKEFSHGDLDHSEMMTWERVAQQFQKDMVADKSNSESEFTNPEEYQKLAQRTQCDQHRALKRINENSHGHQCFATTLLHGVLGMMGELGELAGALERWLWYGQKFDEKNFKEELGDANWYEAELHNAMDASMLETMRANIRKLRSRYPDKYDDHRAAEENRDRKEEMKQAFGNKGKELLTSDEIQEELSDRPVVFQDKREIESGDFPEMEQNGHGWSEPIEQIFSESGIYQNTWGRPASDGPKMKPFVSEASQHEVKPGEGFFVSKEDIDKVLKDTDSFAMKDFPGFSNKAPLSPEIKDNGSVTVGNGVKQVLMNPDDDPKYDLKFWNPFDAARTIADCYAEGQNREKAHQTIRSFEEEFNVERCKRLMLIGMAVMKAIGLDPETSSPEEVEQSINAMIVNYKR